VIAIARAPQKTTLIVGLIIAAPPALAPIMPSTARKTNEPNDTVGISQDVGARSVRTRGAAAPAEKVAAEAKAACLLAAAWRLANQMARKLGWIVSASLLQL